MAARLAYESIRGQCVVLLLAGLTDLGGQSTRLGTLAYIDQQGFFDLHPEDRLPYPAAPDSEPRWEALLTWASKVCIKGGCMREDESGSWHITDEGRSLHAQCVEQFGNGVWDISRCYLWSDAFKRRFVANYASSDHDAQRPRTLYENVERQVLTAVFN